MKSTKETSVRRLSSGSFVVSGVRSRSAVTGRFLGSNSAKKTSTASDGATTKDPRTK